jgi:DCN1-like protein 1/2
MEQEIRDPAKFKDIYQFTFSYAKNPEQKGLGEFDLQKGSN